MKMLKISHRGAGDYEPENTLKSFSKALELKVDMIELDVQLCKTGELVVMHDIRVDRTTNSKGYVGMLSFDELRKLDAGKGEKIPLLTEVLDLVDRKAKLNIELKGPGTAEAVCKIINEYVKDKGWEYDDFIVSCFDHYALGKVKQIIPELRISALLAGCPIGFCEFAEKIKAWAVQLHIRTITPEYVEDAHKRGLKVIAWDADHPDDINLMKQMKVDGIISNYPDKI